MSIPTRLIKPPTKTKKGLLLATDDNLEYLLKEIAKIKQLAPRVILHRIARHGWDSPYILAPKAEKGKSIAGETFTFGEMGNSAWRALSDRTRGYNLRRLRPMGTWERARQKSKEAGNEAEERV